MYSDFPSFSTNILLYYKIQYRVPYCIFFSCLFSLLQSSICIWFSFFFLIFTLRLTDWYVLQNANQFRFLYLGEETHRADMPLFSYHIGGVFYHYIFLLVNYSCLIWQFLWCFSNVKLLFFLFILHSFAVGHSKDGTQVFLIIGRFFSIWVTRDSLVPKGRGIKLHF